MPYGNRHTNCHFYPRPPRGGRHTQLAVLLGISLFLSTPSARRATVAVFRSSASIRNFYPRPPRGGRLIPNAEAEPDVEFLSTPSARRATWPGPPSSDRPRNFYPRPPRGGRPRDATTIANGMRNFYPRPPRGGRPTTNQRGGTASLFLSTPSARRATAAAL